MDKSMLNRYTRGTAEYVVAHAMWQHSRGRRPSEPFMGFKNPATALAVARMALRNGRRPGRSNFFGLPKAIDRRTYEVDPMAGSQINSVIREAVGFAEALRARVQFKFNDSVVIATSHSTEAGLFAAWQQERDRLVAEYRNSPEGKRQQRESEDRKNSMQRAVDQLMQRFETLDYSNLDELVQFFDDLTDPSDYIGVSFDRGRVIDEFVQHGYGISANTGSAFDENDRENFARYLVGQALSGLQFVGAVHHIYHRMAQEWREKFTNATASV